MKILVSNDDGYFAEGLLTLVDALKQIADVTVIAPEQDRSGASNSLTLDRPLSIKTAPNGFLFVNGTPSDCVHMAITGMLTEMPDVVISGINLGANMGDDTVYSGTVAAATEAHLLGIPAIAISLVTNRESKKYFSTAAQIACDLVKQYQIKPFTEATLLNVNVPDIAYENLKGYSITRLGKRHKAEPVIPAQTPTGKTVYWIGAAGPAQDAGAGTDFYAVENQQVSITPLQIDLTNNRQIPLISNWLSNF